MSINTDNRLLPIRVPKLKDLRVSDWLEMMVELSHPMKTLCCQDADHNESGNLKCLFPQQATGHYSISPPGSATLKQSRLKERGTNPKEIRKSRVSKKGHHNLPPFGILRDR